MTTPTWSPTSVYACRANLTPSIPLVTFTRISNVHLSASIPFPWHMPLLICDVAFDINLTDDLIFVAAPIKDQYPTLPGLVVTIGATRSKIDTATPAQTRHDNISPLFLLK